MGARAGWPELGPKIDDLEKQVRGLRLQLELQDLQQQKKKQQKEKEQKKQNREEQQKQQHQ
ncbi:uncharacterized protein PG998_008500 [Apiospora kogelbergensis]|uniref:uncharacterized protein n=1 Tax=Apiospora kogelbergensis TaxID=1337665 RepID=UPI00313009C6